MDKKCAVSPNKFTLVPEYSLEEDEHIRFTHLVGLGDRSLKWINVNRALDTEDPQQCVGEVVPLLHLFISPVNVLRRRIF